SYLPAIPLLMLHGQYDYRLAPTVALLTALAGVNLYVRTNWGTARRLGLFVVLSAVLYYFAGGVSVLFAVLCGIFELVRKRQIVLGVLYLVTAPILPLVFAMYSYQVDVSEAFVNLHPYRRSYVSMRLGSEEEPDALKKLLSRLSLMHGGLMLLFPLAALGAALRRHLARVRAALARALRGLGARLRGRDAPGPFDASGNAAARPGWTFTALGLFLLVGIALMYVSFDVDVKRWLQVDDCGSRGDWQGVLRAARQVRGDTYNVYVMHEVNRALYHTGRLPYDMCSYPQLQHPPSIMLASVEMTSLGYAKFAEWSLELGGVNFAQHWGQLALEIEGDSPRLLKLLVRVSILRGRTEAARTYLGELAKNLLYRDWAEAYQRRLDEDPLQKGDPGLQNIRTVMIDRDYGYGGFGGFDYESMIRIYLRTNPGNRMAFEYLMAYYLLTRQFDRVCANLGRLDDFDYEGIPRMYEEATLLQAHLHPESPINLHGRRVSPASVARFKAFLADIAPYEDGPESGRPQALEVLIRKWGDSYFFFGVFGFSEPRRGWKMTPGPAPAGVEGQ
ncbi:MAG TPA: DUF6057 family protein, partial [Planctomycetota bacterium]|nr:DUF6057 family protein [Planctomycetota bacterium]